MIRELKQKQKLKKTDEQESIEESASDCDETEKTVEELKRPRTDLLTVVVYAGTAFVYAEFLFLLYLLNLCQFTLGFIFLISCTFVIAFFTFKVIIFDFFLIKDLQ